MGCESGGVASFHLVPSHKRELHFFLRLLSNSWVDNPQY